MRTAPFAKILPGLAAIALLIPLAAIAEEFTETLTLDCDELKLVNMIGQVQLVGTSGSDYEIEIRVQGEDASRDVITIETSGRDEKLVRVVFPLDEEDRFVYPPMGRGNTTFSFTEREDEEESFIGKLLDALSADRIKVSGRGRGMEVWADVTIKVPVGRSTLAKVGVGEITARSIEGDLNLDISSGRVSAEDVDGDVLGDTGSGSIAFSRLRGNVSADTGSGSVKITDCAGDRILADTGSGTVTVREAECHKLVVDTGSGRVKAVNIMTDAAHIDTGSGSIYLELLRMGDGRYNLDTGSGSIELVVPRDLSARVSCDTGSGGIDIELDGVDLPRRRDHDDDVEFTVGSGDARIICDTGSGGITVRH